MFKFAAHFISYRAKELKDSVVGTAKDAKKVTAVAAQTLQDDFHSIGQAVATASDRIDQTVRQTDKERFHVADDPGKRAEQEDKKFVFNEHAENPLNKAAKMAHDAKESIKEKMTNTKENIREKLNNTKEDIIENLNHTNENIKEKLTDAKDAAKSAYEKSKDAVVRSQHSKVEQMAKNVIGKGKLNTSRRSC